MPNLQPRVPSPQPRVPSLQPRVPSLQPRVPRYQQLAALLTAELQPLSVQLAEQHARLQATSPSYHP